MHPFSDFDSNKIAVFAAFELRFSFFSPAG
jgi:hypothetical protein